MKYASFAQGLIGILFLGFAIILLATAAHADLTDTKDLPTASPTWLCKTPEGTAPDQIAHAKISLDKNGQIRATVSGATYNGRHRRNIDYVFTKILLRLLDPSTDYEPQTLTYSSGSIQERPPRLTSADGTFDITDESVAVILIKFNVPVLTEKTQSFEARLLFYQRYYVHDLFADGGHGYALRCQKIL